LIWDFDSPVDDPEHANTNTMSSEFGIASSDVPLDLEYSIAPGDSGGGSYLFESGQWWLAGVTSGDADIFYYPPDPPLAPGDPPDNNRVTYGDVNVVTRVSSFQGFIDGFVPASVPEPGPMVACTLLFAAFWLRRRKP